MALENHVFLPFGPYSALIKPSSHQSGLKVWLLVKLPNQDEKQVYLVVIIRKIMYYFSLLLEILFSPFVPYSALMLKGLVQTK